MTFLGLSLVLFVFYVSIRAVVKRARELSRARKAAQDFRATIARYQRDADLKRLRNYSAPRLSTPAAKGFRQTPIRFPEDAA